MHTFFINTSSKSINSYDVLFDIHYENKTLVTLECPMADWYKKENGYAVCVAQMGNMIDGYVELNNAFNLIVYIDLPEIKAYADITRDALHDREREACCRAMHILYTHVITESLLAELNNAGRHPQNALVLFGQEKKFVSIGIAESDPNRNAVKEKLLSFLGIPEKEALETLAKEVTAEDMAERVAEFEAKFRPVSGQEIVPGIREHYREDFDIWFEEILHNANVDDANEALFDRILDRNTAEMNREGVQLLYCPYDTYACRVNKSALALSQLNLALHILKCVTKGSIYEIEDDTETSRLIPFHAYKMEEVAPLFRTKERIYEAKAEEIGSMIKSYAELGLAEPVRILDYAQFGLDEYGDKAVDLMIVDVDEEEKEKEKTEEEQEENTTDKPLVDNAHKAVVVVRQEGERLLTKEEYEPFDYNFDIGEEAVLRRDTKPIQYIERAKKLRKHHLDYLKKLKLHVFRVLSNYAGKSKENKPAILGIGRGRYATSNNPDNRMLEEIESISTKAYDAMFDQYMEFCAGRSVAITDIEEQCNWFVSRIDQIEQSIRKITLVAIGILVGLLALYAPYIALQLDAIIKDPLTIVMGLCSLAVPLLLLYLIFILLATAQKRKYLKAWEEFKARSDEALKENSRSVKKYDKLLSVVIPALRWIYEYKLDVEYCVECCGVADAKVEHHRRKLRDRVTAIRNILSDLEYNPEGEYLPKLENAADAIDFTAPFCTGKRNKDFYTVINDSFFKTAEH